RRRVARSYKGILLRLFSFSPPRLVAEPLAIPRPGPKNASQPRATVIPCRERTASPGVVVVSAGMSSPSPASNGEQLKVDEFLKALKRSGLLERAQLKAAVSAAPPQVRAKEADAAAL